ncbi:hypothetical protein MPL3356_40589 [Mesorhizobium plurifarium]|uniref:Uncharacterized protein n=1 Tax=Mesorhizobium plurifarium TaxID=69974 RepID=A0A090E384_MESPL|nr:hypothetical protein MPL3356_40589 [Mesorhizobium plurifarium]
MVAIWTTRRWKLAHRINGPPEALDPPAGKRLGGFHVACTYDLGRWIRIPTISEPIQPTSRDI